MFGEGNFTRFFIRAWVFYDNDRPISSWTTFCFMSRWSKTGCTLVTLKVWLKFFNHVMIFHGHQGSWVSVIERSPTFFFHPVLSRPPSHAEPFWTYPWHSTSSLLFTIPLIWHWMRQVDGAEWKRQRKITSASFNEQSSNIMWTESTRQAEELLYHWKSQKATIGMTAKDCRTQSLHVLSSAGLCRLRQVLVI